MGCTDARAPPAGRRPEEAAPGVRWADQAASARGRARRLERDVEHLADGHDRVEGHLLADVRGHVVEVAAVALGEDHVGEARGVGGEHLLLQAADRQHAALQRDLAGHADRVLDRAAGQERRQRGRHRDAGARAVLRDRARRDVHVELAVVEGVVRDAELAARARARR